MQALLQNTTVKLAIQHNISSMKVIEARFDLAQSIGSMKENIETRYGSLAAYMRLELKLPNNQHVASLADDSRPLGFYGAQTGMILMVIDDNPTSIHKQIESYEGVQKYVISESDYSNLPENFRKWKDQLIKAHPELLKDNLQAKTAKYDPEYQGEGAANLQLGRRCRLQTGPRGEICYIGKIMDLGAGYYIGVRLDQPFGTSNGVIKGVRYFSAQQKYATFVRPDVIEQGDFPILDLDDQI